MKALFCVLKRKNDIDNLITWLYYQLNNFIKITYQERLRDRPGEVQQPPNYGMVLTPAE